ncbi:hypothetical protein K4K49_006309 [Colletotrichum sp. SAR 10_70]|nr:hypothetical protein K4K50_006300 [Colletotrichum sp. SAR 10_71]KAI8163155.1 hypothetical protein K4K49_006309 [Colletotrichum sp. SAR 10_70]
MIPIASSPPLLDCAQARRNASTFLGFGVAKDAPGVIGHDISTATQRFSGISPADSKPTRKKTVAESNVENPITPQARKQEGISAAEEGHNGYKNQGAIENRPIATSSAASNIKSHENSLEDEAIPEAEDIEPENEANHTESQREGSDIESEDEADFDGSDTSEGESYIEANDYILDDPDDPDTSASNPDATSGQAATGGKDEVVGEQSVAEEPDAQAGGSFEEDSYSSFEHFRHAEPSLVENHQPEPLNVVPDYTHLYYEPDLTSSGSYDSDNIPEADCNADSTRRPLSQIIVNSTHSFEAQSDVFTLELPMMESPPPSESGLLLNSVASNMPNPGIVSETPSAPDADNADSRKRKGRSSSPDRPSRRIRHSPDGSPMEEYYKTLAPATWLTGCVISAALNGVSSLLHNSTFVADSPASNMQEPTDRAHHRIVSVLTLAQNKETTIVMPVAKSGHWNVAVAVIHNSQASIDLYDSMPSDASSRNALVNQAKERLQKLTTAAGSRDPELKKRLDELDWTSRQRHSTMQQNGQDCGVAVILHCFHAFAGIPPPVTTDWLLWRRIIAVLLFTHAQEGSDVDGANQPGGPPSATVLDDIRAAHAKALFLSAKPEIDCSAPEGLHPLMATSDSPSSTGGAMYDTDAVAGFITSLQSWALELSRRNNEALTNMKEARQLTTITISDMNNLIFRIRTKGKEHQNDEQEKARVKAKTIEQRLRLTRETLERHDSPVGDIEIASLARQRIAILEAEEKEIVHQQARRLDERKAVERGLDAIEMELKDLKKELERAG